MNISGDFVQAYDQVEISLNVLKGQCDPILKGLARAVGGSWQGSRVKPRESVLLKIERDGISFDQFKDLFAATIVVPNSSLLSLVEEKIIEGNMFRIVEKVPRKTKNPREFVYDDLHLILKQYPDPVDGDPHIENINFELQVKTAMQAAWSAITRDSYKTKRLSSERARLDSRIRALVEMADDTLSQLVASLENTEEAVQEPYEEFSHLNEIIALLENAVPSQIPDDRGRMARIVDAYLKECQPEMTLSELGSMLEKPEYNRIRDAMSLAATESILIILFLEERLTRLPGDPTSLYGTRRYFITSEMIDLCPQLRDVPESRRVNLRALGYISQ